MLFCDRPCSAPNPPRIRIVAAETEIGSPTKDISIPTRVLGDGTAIAEGPRSRGSFAEASFSNADILLTTGDFATFMGCGPGARNGPAHRLYEPMSARPSAAARGLT